MYRYFEVYFPTLDTGPLMVHDLTFNQARYAHETMTIFLKNWALGVDALATQTPVRVILRGDKTSREFIGHIHHIKPDISPTRNYVEVHVIGASFPMKQQSQKVWINTTASTVVETIAKKHRFSYVCTPTKRIYPQILQGGGESDWEFMGRLAKQNGCTLRAENTTIYFEPLTKGFTDLREMAEVYLMGSLAAPSVTRVFSFKPLVGEAIPYKDSMKSAVAVGGSDSKNPTGHSYSVQQPTSTRENYSAPLFDSFNANVVAPSFETAKYEAEAAQERMRYPYRATAVLYGDPSLKPDTPIYLDGVGSDHSGYWTVLSAEHTIEGLNYHTTVELGTDSLGLSTQWEDGKTVAAPNPYGKRTIISGQLNVNQTAGYSLINAGQSVSTATPKSFGLVTNQPVRKVGNQNPVITRWASTSGNLAPIVSSVPPTPAAIYARLAKMNAI